MAVVNSNAGNVFGELHQAYMSKSNADIDVLIKSMGDDVLDLIASMDGASSIFIWLFSQLYDHWIIPDEGIVNESFCPPIKLQELIVDRLMGMVDEIEHGRLRIVPLYDINDTAADIPYRVSNGWNIIVYSRLYCWHRLEGFTTPDNIFFDPWLMTEENLKDRIFNHSPSEDVQRNIYGFKQAV